MNARSTFLARALLAVGATVVALLVGEAAVRSSGVEPAEFMVRDRNLGQKYRPLLHIVLYDEESQRRVAVAINSIGFRDREHDVASPPGMRRVVMLGDSFTAGLSVDFENTFPQICERLLDESGPGGTWEVMTLAVAGDGTAQELLAYEQYGHADHPSVVVLNCFAGNDVSDNSPDLSTSLRPYFRLIDGRLVGSWPSESRRRVTTWLNDYSRLYTWQKRQMQKVERFVKRDVVIDPVLRVFMSRSDEVMVRAWAVTESLISSCARAWRLMAAACWCHTFRSGTE